MENKQTFMEAIKELMGFDIEVFLIDGATTRGLLIHAEDDLLVLEKGNDQPHYYKFDQILAVSKNTRLFHQQPITTEFVPGESLNEILAGCRYKWVTLRSGQDTFEGVLSRVFDEHLVLISKDESLLINKAVISHVYLGELQEEKKEESTSSSDEEKSDSTDEMKDHQKAENQEKPNEKNENRLDPMEIEPLPPINLDSSTDSGKSHAYYVEPLIDATPFVMERNIFRQRNKKKNIEKFEGNIKLPSK